MSLLATVLQEQRLLTLPRSYKLELADGTPADPPTLRSAVTAWSNGDTIPLGRRAVRVVAIRDDDADQPPVLVVEN